MRTRYWHAKPRSKVRMRAQLGDLHGRTGIALFLLAQLKELLGITNSKVRPCGSQVAGWLKDCGRR
jgi:hypothetical protein